VRLLKYKRDRYAYFFVAPLVIVMLAVFLYPIVRVAMMSVQDWYMVRPARNGEFVGLSNYARMFADRYFKNSITVSVIYILVTVPARFLLGFVTAVLLNNKFRGRAIARALVIIPWAVPEAVTCLVWILMYDKDFGIINSVLRNIGLISHNIGYLQSTGVALSAAMVVNVWKGFPFVAIMLLAGLQGIPDELYEASMVDGSNAWQRMRYITIPMLKPVSMIVFLLLVIWTIRDFGIVYLLARGGPSKATEVFTVYLYQSAFTNFDFGMASSGGILMLAFALVFSFLYIRMINKEGRAL
jgi:multiple sugar transport system permease protein